MHIFELQNTLMAYYFNLTYGFIGLFGGVLGLWSARRWGGFSSTYGKSIIFLSLGLLSQWLANAIWAFYNIVLQIETPYPSVADIFFFLAMPLYATALIYLTASAGGKISFKSVYHKIIFTLLPFTAMAIAYNYWLRDSFQYSTPLQTFFDIGYPLGAAFTLSLSLICLLVVRNKVGGIMSAPIVFAIFAYFVQFIADNTFLYTLYSETYYNGNWVDVLYALALTSMSSAILNFSSVFEKVASMTDAVEMDLGSMLPMENIDSISGVEGESLIRQIVEDQSNIIGSSTAYDIVNKIKGLQIINGSLLVQKGADTSTVIRDLTQAFYSLFGKTALFRIKDTLIKYS